MTPDIRIYFVKSIRSSAVKIGVTELTARLATDTRVEWTPPRPGTEQWLA